MENIISSIFTSTSGRPSFVTGRCSTVNTKTAQRRCQTPLRWILAASSLDDQADKQFAKEKQIKKLNKRDVDDLKSMMIDPKEDALLDNVDSLDQQWQVALSSFDYDFNDVASMQPFNAAFEGSDNMMSSATLNIGGDLQSLPYDGSDDLLSGTTSELLEQGRPSYRTPASAVASSSPLLNINSPFISPNNMNTSGGGGGSIDAYIDSFSGSFGMGPTSNGMPQMTGGSGFVGTLPVRSLEDMSPEEVALEEYLMNKAVDDGMWLHHARLEQAHSRYAVSIKYAQILEEIEMEDWRRGAVPLVPKTGQKMPSWIRASEAIMPHLDALNEATKQAELELNERELQRIHDSILKDVAEAEQLIAVTDPFAGVREQEPTTAPEALDELFGDADTLLPGATLSNGLTEEMLGVDAEQISELMGNPGSLEGIAKQVLKEMMYGVDFDLNLPSDEDEEDDNDGEEEGEDEDDDEL